MEGFAEPWQEFQFRLKDDLLRQVRKSGQPENEVVRMVGLVFARPESGLGKTEIIPHLSYFHQRSADFITFYFIGYADSRRTSGSKKVAEFAGREWTFDDWHFDDTRRVVEARSKWRYSGSADLILTNARLQPTLGNALGELTADLDWASAICADLEELKRCGAILSVERFFEDIFRYAESQDGRDPT